MTKEYQQEMGQWRDFLEATPAYVRCRFDNILVDTTPNMPGVFTYGIFSPRIQLHCDTDGGIRWWDPLSPTIACASYANAFVTYRCRDCGESRKAFALVLSANLNTKPPALTAMKLGEFPPFGSHLAKRLQNMLSATDLELYRKGLRTEREGHGIGAAAYYRRVVDNQWKALVKKLRDAAEKLGTAKDKLSLFDEALEQTQFSAAVELLRDTIPAKLLILDGKNPLTLLYHPLSVQIHDLSDEQCLQQAADIRIVLNETFDNISRVLREDEELKAAVSRLQGF